MGGGAARRGLERAAGADPGPSRMHGDVCREFSINHSLSHTTESLSDPAEDIERRLEDENGEIRNCPKEILIAVTPKMSPAPIFSVLARLTLRDQGFRHEVKISNF